MYRILMKVDKVISVKFSIISVLSNIIFLNLGALTIEGHLATRKPLQALSSFNEIRRNATISNYIPNIQFIYYDS